MNVHFMAVPANRMVAVDIPVTVYKILHVTVVVLTTRHDITEIHCFCFNEQALRILRLFGNTTSHRVIPYVGPEQEYFLVDKELYRQRKDLMFCGRTLLGAPAPKGQEMEDHYFGVLKPRVSAYMHDLDEALWKLGIPAKTKHNEVAPCQHELAPIFDTTNVAIDHNLLTMEMMKKLAPKYGLVCLQHEKPFEGVNGSEIGRASCRERV